MRIRLDLDPATTAALGRAAAKERRPVGWQAEVILQRVLGTLDEPPPPDRHDRLHDAVARFLLEGGAGGEPLAPEGPGTVAVRISALNDLARAVRL